MKGKGGRRSDEKRLKGARMWKKKKKNGVDRYGGRGLHPAPNSCGSRAATITSQVGVAAGRQSGHSIAMERTPLLDGSAGPRHTGESTSRYGVLTTCTNSESAHTVCICVFLTITTVNIVSPNSINSLVLLRDAVSFL
jgi:hypothetical protein